MEYLGQLSLCIGVIGIAALFVLIFALHYLSKWRVDNKQREGSAKAFSDIARQNGWDYSPSVTPSLVPFISTLHNAVAIIEGSSLSTQWPQATENFLSGTKNNVAFTVFDHTYYKGNFKSRQGYRPTIFVRGVLLRHPDISLPEFSIAPKPPDAGVMADMMDFAGGTAPQPAWGIYSLRSPEARRWPPGFDQVLQKLESKGILLAFGNAGFHCVMFERDDLKPLHATEIHPLIDAALNVTSELLAEMRRLTDRGGR